ncbi:galactosylceramide sulfotransferase [Hyalella azteca]|uniref:Galactosylceramide sulfotransferase n=1 Tax=Hyalella azteca TaxID=294128 RepID=A0A8B7NL74_HYAAZ|nr:galactosylceramide sulfotransferase [Hyalella azteca]
MGHSLQKKLQLNKFLLVLVLVGFALITTYSFLLHENVTTEASPSSPVQHIMFLKTHKCASSSVQNMFLRYAYNHNLTLALPASLNYLGNPLLFQSGFIPKPLLPSKGVVDIFAVHSRLNLPEHRKVLHPDSVFITVVRDPVNLFESLYNYFYLKYYYDLTLAQYMELPFGSQFDMYRAAEKFGPDMMLFDLGYTVKANTTDREFTEIINEVDKIFDLVMIAERIDESLILMKKLLNWEYEDIVFYNKNARRRSYKQKLTQKLREKIRKLNKGDQLLYDHFLLRHEEAVRNYGTEKMAEEVELLRVARDDIFGQCKMKKFEGRPPNKIFQEYSILVETFTIEDLTDENCLMLSLPELQLLDFVRAYQTKMLKNT